MGMGSITGNLLEQPAAATLILDWPDTLVEGTDDFSTGDEEDTPYSAAETLDFKAKGGQPAAPASTPDVGQVSSCDNPDVPYVLLTAGQEGEELVGKSEFREFVRLQIGDPRRDVLEAIRDQ